MLFWCYMLYIISQLSYTTIPTIYTFAKRSLFSFPLHICKVFFMNVLSNCNFVGHSHDLMALSFYLDGATAGCFNMSYYV